MTDILDPKRHTSVWRFFLYVNRQEIPWIVADSFLYNIGTILILGLAYFIGKLVDALNGHHLVRPWIWLIIISLIICEICYRVGHIIEIKIRADVRSKIKKALFNHTHQLSFGYFSDRMSGKIAHQVSQAAEAIDWAVVIITNDWINIIATILISIIILGSLATNYGIFLIIWGVALVIGLYFLAKKMNRSSGEWANQSSKTTGALADVYTNISTVKVYGQGDDKKSITQQIDIEARAMKQEGIVELYMFIWQGLFLVILGIGLIWISATLYQNNLVTIGTLVAASTIGLRLYASVWSWGPSLSKLIQSLGEAQQSLDDLVVAPKVVDPSESHHQKQDKITIEYYRVNFSYHQDRSILKDFSLKISPNEKIGIVGLSGAGKSTFANLLLRFFDVQSGEILLNNLNIKDFTQDFLRSHISYISQDTSLFHATIAENISYGSNAASPEEIKRAAKLACADEFIQTLPDKYESVVGERGIKLSGGQRQRIAIARAILADRPIFLLDEATSALDSDSEQKIQKGLDQLMKNKTVIAIAHRLSTLSHMDRIIYLESGQITETGTHRELLKLNGHYAKLWHRQAGGFLPDK